MGGLESRMSSAQTARRLARCVTLYLGFRRKSSCGAVLSGRCAACLMATGHAESLMHVQGKQIKSKEIMRPRLAAGMHMDEMDDICRNNRVNRSEVIVDVTYRTACCFCICE